MFEQHDTITKQRQLVRRNRTGGTVGGVNTRLITAPPVAERGGRRRRLQQDTRSAHELVLLDSRYKKLPPSDTLIQSGAIKRKKSVQNGGSGELQGEHADTTQVDAHTRRPKRKRPERTPY